MQSDGNQKVLSAPISGASGPYQHDDSTALHRGIMLKADSFGHAEPSFRGVSMPCRKVPVPCIRGDKPAS